MKEKHRNVSNLFGLPKHFWHSHKRKYQNEFILLALILLLSNNTVFADAGIMRLVPVADTFVSENQESASRGSLTTLVIGPQPDQGLKSHIFMRFDVSDVPRDAVVSSANLYLFEQEQTGYVSWQIDLHSPQSTWMEEGINWINKPAVVQMGTDRMDTAEPYKYLDLSSLVQGWINGSIPNNGVMLSATDEDAGAHFSIVFRSREAADCRPYLEIAYTTEETVPHSEAPPSCTPGTDNDPPKIDAITVDVDPQPPKAGEPLLVEAVAKDNNGVYRIELWRDGQLVGVNIDPSFPTQLSVSNPVGTILPPGRYSYTAFAWDQSMNATAISRDIQVIHDGNPPRLRISHWPREPDIGETVTFQIDAEDESGIKHVTFTANSLTRDYSLDPAVQNFSPSEIRFDEYTLGYSPDDIRIIRYSASATDTEGFLASTGTGYVVFGNSDADDADSDGVSDEIENLLGTDAASNDTDGDGLYDGWEILGVERNGVYLNLPLWGANPHQKDIFVEIDWMQDEDHDKKPQPAALQAITNAFLNHGIHLHFDTGNLGGGNVLAYEESCDDQTEKLRQTKIANFDPNRLGIFYYVAAMAVVPGDDCGSKAINNTNIILRNKTVYGYATTLMHELGHVLNLGHGGQEWATSHPLQTVDPNGEIITDDHIHWTDQTLNYKPNYLSVMNYHYQFSLRVCARPPDLEPCTCIHHLSDVERQNVVNPCDDVRPLTYNRWQAELDETALDETSGFRAPANLGPYVWRREIPGGVDENSYEFVLDRPTLQGWYYIKHHPAEGCCTNQWEVCGPNPKTESVWELADGSPIDWNFSGVIDDDPVEYDLNRYWAGGASNVCREVVDRTLEASFDSAVLKTQHWAENLAWGISESLSPFNSPEIKEPTDAEFADGIDNDRDGSIDEGFVDADGDGVADPLDNCPFIKNSNQFDTNQNYMGDACEGMPEAPKDLRIVNIDGEMRLQWSSSEATNVIGYNVFRKSKDSIDYQRLGISFPTTLGSAFYKNPECVDGNSYAISSVDLHMKESRLSAGVILSDTDGDAVCDKITRRLSNPYHDDLDSDHLFEMWWVFVLIIIVILIIFWIVYLKRLHQTT